MFLMTHLPPFILPLNLIVSSTEGANTIIDLMPPLSILYLVNLVKSVCCVGSSHSPCKL
jgi:hypothetical protein